MLRKVLILSVVALFSGVAVAAEGKDEVASAAKKLGAGSYSWKQTSEAPGGQGARGGGTTEGKVAKDGLVMVTTTRGNNTTEVLIKAKKAAVKTADGWQSAEDAAQGQGGGRFVARMAQNFKAPADQAAELAAQTKSLALADGVYSGDLTEEGAKALMAFGGRGGANAPQIAGAKGTAKFWVKEGVLEKYQYQVQGKMTFNDQEREINRTTTVQISNIGSTNVDAPEEAKKLVQ